MTSPDAGQDRDPGARHWPRVRDVFLAALDLADEDRAAYVRRECAGDEVLEHAVLRLLRLDAESGSFLEQPAITALAPFIAPAEASLAAGTVLAGRYRIVALIGSGGMGEVYEARDEVIDDVVAVKVIRAELEPIEAVAARWRSEALLARKVSHAGVCRVHDVAVHRDDRQELLLLTMERVRGESLAARLDSGPIPLDEALGIARQIASALDTAHAQGVLHRDVKPDNVLLEPADGGQWRVVLTDFGLAHDLSPDAAAIAPGVLAGTPGYMAPELLRGAAPSTRSDLYAFALVIQTLVTQAVPVLTARGQAVFDRALDADPQRRLETATALVEAVADAIVPRPWWRLRRRGRIALAAGLAIAVALFGAAFRIYGRGPSPIASASQVLLTSVVNRTSDRDLDGTNEVLRSQLALSTHFELLEPQRIRAALTEMRRADGDLTVREVAREIAMRENVPLVVYPTLTRDGGGYAFVVTLEHVGVRPTLARSTWSESFQASSRDGLFDAVHAAAVWIRQTAGEVPAALESQDRASKETASSSWEALRLFRQAESLSAAERGNDATLVLEQALRIDPEFVMAQMRLADILIGLKRDKDGYSAWQRAMVLAERAQPTSRAALRIRAQYFGDADDLPAALKAFQTYAIHYPNDYYPAISLGTLLTDLSRRDEALPWLEKALSLRPRSLSAAVFLALAYLDAGRAADFERTVERVASLDAADWAAWLRTLAVFTSGQVDRAIAGLEPLRNSNDLQWRSRVSTIRASWLTEAGREAEAREELRFGITFDAAQGFRDRLADKWLHLAELQRRRGDHQAASSVMNAIDTASNPRRLALAASILVRLGEVAEARRLLAAFDDLPQVYATIAGRNQVAGELALAAGDVSQALSLLERGLATRRKSDSRLPLARARIAAGELDRAERLLMDAVSHPAFIYSVPEPRGPGLWRETIVLLIGLVERRDAAAAVDLRRRFSFVDGPGVNRGH